MISSISYTGRLEKLSLGKFSCRAILRLLLIAPLVFMLTSCADSRVEKLIAKANEEWVKGRNHSAVELFKSVLEVTPSGPYAEEALFRIGEIYHFGLGDSAQAINYFQELVQINKQGTYAYSARKYIAEIVEFTFKDYEQAIIENQNLINEYDRGDENGDHQFRIASIYFKIQKYDQAMVELEILLENYPNNKLVEEAQYKIIEILYTLDRCPEAREQYHRFIDGSPQSPFRNEAEFILASCLEEEGELVEALKKFTALMGKYKYPDLLVIKLEGIKSRILKKQKK